MLLERSGARAEGSRDSASPPGDPASARVGWMSLGARRKCCTAARVSCNSVCLSATESAGYLWYPVRHPVPLGAVKICRSKVQM